MPTRHLSANAGPKEDAPGLHSVFLSFLLLLSVVIATLGIAIMVGILIIP